MSDGRDTIVKHSRFLWTYLDTLYSWCPGCNCPHPIPDPARWHFNGDYENPNFSPSFQQNGGRPDECHYNIENGHLHFHASGTHHDLRGDTPLGQMPDEPTFIDRFWNRHI